ncbi:hypothetical protein [Burkholderia guangdongensis]|uniref:hypothetical protein n=1 Tax=Burkholderia guangdongensis TaxID=1792500 RepID=UPI0015CB28EC|nr:hypothetical protein [Burkholderia guangdongensis]
MVPSSPSPMRSTPGIVAGADLAAGAIAATDAVIEGSTSQVFRKNISVRKTVSADAHQASQCPDIWLYLDFKKSRLKQKKYRRKSDLTLVNVSSQFPGDGK